MGYDDWEEQWTSIRSKETWFAYTSKATKVTTAMHGNRDCEERSSSAQAQSCFRLSYTTTNRKQVGRLTEPKQ